MKFNMRVWWIILKKFHIENKKNVYNINIRMYMKNIFCWIVIFF